MLLKRLLEPGRIGKLWIRNRTIMSPMLKNYGNRDGSVTQKYIDYFVERARGGVGLIMTEATYISPEAKGNKYQLGLYDDWLIEGSRRLTNAVHRYGAKIGVELQHRGRQTAMHYSYRQLVAPSQVIVHGSQDSGYKELGDVPRELSLEDIRRVISDFGEAARRAKEAGFDAVMLHGGHGYLLNQFLSPYTNRRTDEYGGSLEKREKFILDVIEAVRKAVGEDFPVIYRVSADEFIEGGLTLEHTLHMAPLFEKVGIDLIDVSVATHESIHMLIPSMETPPGPMVFMARAIKKLVDVPVSIVNRINTPILAENILADESADFIVFGRALHADPYLVRKAAEGRFDDIRYCVACCEGCLDVLITHEPVTCAVNPAAGKEREMALQRAKDRKRVLVVGGGPAGMEAARVCALRGHRVSLYEKEKELGGQLRYARMAPSQEAFEDLIVYLSNQIGKLGVEIHLGVEMTAETIYEDNSDAVIIATGAKPFIPLIPGREQEIVATTWELFSGRRDGKKRAVVVGGDMIGCEAALYLSQRGCRVSIVEPGRQIGTAGKVRSLWWVARRVLQEPLIDVRLRSTVEQIGQRFAKIQTEGVEEIVDQVDLVVISAGMISDSALGDRLKRDLKIRELHTIGDCVIAANMMQAVADGRAAGCRI